MAHDNQLLRQFVAENSQAAFRELVERHSHWLYSVCLRRLGDSALAEDATQLVFLALSQRAPSLLKEQAISPWLHQAARYCALNIRRSRARREHHESKAAAMKSEIKRATDSSAQFLSESTAESNSKSVWHNIEADLEPAMDRLGSRDRQAILLRFYEQRTHPEIAALLGISLEASQKRLSRALERLRAQLLRKGDGGSAACSSLALGELLVSHSLAPAPASLLTSLSAPGSAASAALAPVAKKVAFSMAFESMKATVLTALIFLIAIPAGLMFFHSWNASPVSAQVSQPAVNVPPPPEANVSSAATSGHSATAPSSIYKIPNTLFLGTSANKEFAIGLDPDTQRTPDSLPAGHIKSLLVKYPVVDQARAQRTFRGPYTDLAGHRVQLSAWLKTKNVDEMCGLELILIGPDNRLLLFNDMGSRAVHGTTDWSRQQIVADVPANVTGIAVASFLFGKGEVWSDDFQLQAVGTDVPLTDNDFFHTWGYYPASYTATPDPQVLHDGHPAVCIAPAPDTRNGKWTVYEHDDMNPEQFRGHHVRVTLWLKSKSVTSGSGPNISVYGPAGKLAGDNQRGHRPVMGTNDWKAYSAECDVPAEADRVSWGLTFNGTGKIWMDVENAQCVIDDK